jgi:flagellin-like protein
MKSKIRRLRKSIKAISPVLAVLMMIAVAIAGSLVTYAWVMGYIGFTTEKSGKALMIQSVVNDGTDTDLMVYVQNVGEGTVELEETSCLYVNGALESCTITGVTKTGTTAKLGEGETATLTLAGGAAAAGEKKTVKVASQLGTFSEKSTYPAEGTGGGGPVAPVLDHFTFDTITTPQTSGAAFSITITARDQYGAAFTSYTGTNDLTYSGGTISPTTTTAFTAGVWTGSVTVTGSGTGVTIGTSAQATPSITGTSNTFNVDAPAPQTITLRPEGTGSVEELDEDYSGVDNWECVEEVVSDGDSYYVYDGTSSGHDTDTYSTENHGSESGTINSVTVYINCRQYGGASGTSYARTALRVSGTNYYGTDNALSSSWTTYSTPYTSNPAGGDWTWSAIDQLQCGVSLDSADASGYNYNQVDIARCTQVWIVVNYTP